MEARDNQRNSERNESIAGTTAADELFGGRGNDFLSGRDGSDRYIFHAGDGQDVIHEMGQFDNDVLRIEGYGVSDARFQLDPADSENLIIDFPVTGDRITIVNTLNDLVFDQIEVIEFLDISNSVVALTMSDVRQRVIASQQTQSDGPRLRLSHVRCTGSGTW